MFKLNEIKELVKLLDETSVQELEIENEGSRILIRKPNPVESVMVHAPAREIQMQQAPAHTHVGHAAPYHETPQQETTQKQDDNLHSIVSPMVGTFYRSPSPTAPSFVNIGDRVDEKSVVCIIEAMKLMNEIEAEVKGEIVEVLVENGQLVEYGQPLFLVKP